MHRIVFARNKVRMSVSGMYNVICRKCGLSASAYNLRDKNKRFAECNFCNIRNTGEHLPDFKVVLDFGWYG